ncbi:MAG TPA: FtsQ-type POTRA domain-containing protein [Clostridiaceae bacterium]|nr:FtsQ-type POTRA domain-containing protein [Clostridiaceae bacterium]
MQRKKSAALDTSDNKTKRNRIKIEIIFVLLLFVIVLFMFIMSPIFNISDIIVDGSSHYTAQEIINASGISIGENGFKNIGGNYKHYILFRYGQAEKNIISSLPYVKDVVVKYIIPNKVIINIEEREPVVLIPYLGTYLLTDRHGYVVETVSNPEEYNFPKIKGLKFSGYEIGQPLEIVNEKNFEDLILLIDTLTNEDKSDNFKITELINSIDISDKNNIHLTIDYRLAVNFGSIEQIDYKIKSLKQIFNKGIGKDEKGFLDFATGPYPVFIPN